MREMRIDVLTLFPEIAVLSSMDADHLDIYKSVENIHQGFESYIAQIREKGKLILKHGLSPKVPDHVSCFTYSVDQIEADYHAVNLAQDGLGYRFSVHTPRVVLPEIKLQIPGLLNVENALAGVLHEKHHHTNCWFFIITGFNSQFWQ